MLVKKLTERTLQKKVRLPYQRNDFHPLIFPLKSLTKPKVMAILSQTGMYITTCESSSSGLVKDPFLELDAL